MKKLFLIMACLLVAACEKPVEIFMAEFHNAASAACENNGGYEKLRIWENTAKNTNRHIAIICNDKAEIFIVKYWKVIDGNGVWSDWQSDDKRFGKWK